jgi:hypothetical protein
MYCKIFLLDFQGHKKEKNTVYLVSKLLSQINFVCNIWQWKKMLDLGRIVEIIYKWQACSLCFRDEETKDK